MSKLLNLTATGSFGGPGFRLGGITLAADTAAATAVITEVTTNGTTTATFTRMKLTAPANQTIPHSMTDWENGAVFDGTVFLATLVGNGASVNVEML